MKTRTNKKVVTNTKSNRAIKSELERQEKEIDIELKKLQASEKKEMVENWEIRKLNDSEERTKIDKINSLRWLLESFTIDEENTLMPSEPKFKRVFIEEEQWKIKDKIFKIIKTL